MFPSIHQPTYRVRPTSYSPKLTLYFRPSILLQSTLLRTLGSQLLTQAGWLAGLCVPRNILHSTPWAMVQPCMTSSSPSPSPSDTAFMHIPDEDEIRVRVQSTTPPRVRLLPISQSRNPIIHNPHSSPSIPYRDSLASLPYPT